MLGHIHKPAKVASNAYYCGSPFALDKSEMGRHGAWLLTTIADSAWQEPQFINLCPFRYERLSVDISGLTDLEQVKSKLTETARTYAASLEEPTHLYLTPVFSGTLAPSLDLSRFFGSADEELTQLFVQDATKVYVLNRYSDETELELDLASLAAGQGPVALLAQMLLDDEMLASLAKEYKILDRDSYNRSAFDMLTKRTLDTDTALQKTKQAGKRLLKAMVVQTQGGN
jgi:DNA repair exonuclease SbcCD nuclease subunit